MCGIVGVLATGALTSDARTPLAGMMECLRHRGPDSAGDWTDEAAGVALGHRRLAVIDVSPAGHQPMTSASGRYVIVFNGEIYNHPELAETLRGHGERFRGHSDTEILLQLVERKGLARALPDLVGMFAFALWDRNERVLHLVRDRIGEKPLYYARVTDGWLFASEPAALRAHPAFACEVSHDALALLLRHGYIPAPYSVYRSVWKVRPGRVVTLRSGAEPDEWEYWSAEQAVTLALSDPLPDDEHTVVDELEAALRRSVRQQLISDVPLGGFLSGGIDSSLVAALMQAESGGRARTFTVGFREPEFDEAPHARQVAEHLGTRHTEEYFTARDALEVVPRLPALYSEPFADSSQLPTHLVAAMARRHVTVALSGDGGDELFAGYERYAWGLRLAAARRALGPLRRPAAGALGLLEALPGTPGDRARRLAGMLAAPDDATLYREIVSLWRDPERGVVEGREPQTRLGRLPPALAGRPLLERMMYWDLVAYLPDDIMAKVDRAAMAVSLETRAPFLNHRVVEFAWRIPSALKRHDGVGKRVLRRVLDRFVPRHLVERPKRGFAVPVDAWLRGPLREWASDLLAPDALRADGYLEAGRIGRLWADHLSGRRSYGYLLWPPLMFQAWLRAR